MSSEFIKLYNPKFEFLNLHPHQNLLTPITRENGKIKPTKDRRTIPIDKISEASKYTIDPLIFKYIEEAHNIDHEKFKQTINSSIKNKSTQFITNLFSINYGNNNDDKVSGNIFHRIIEHISEDDIKNTDLINQYLPEFLSEKEMPENNLQLEIELRQKNEFENNVKKLTNTINNINYLINISSIDLLNEEDINGMKPYELALDRNNFFLAQELKQPQDQNYIVDPEVNIENLYIRKNILNRINEKIREKDYFKENIDKDLKIASEFRSNDVLENKFFGYYDILSNFIEYLPLRNINKYFYKKDSTSKNNETNLNKISQSSPQKKKMSIKVIKKNIEYLKEINRNSKKDYLKILEEKIKDDFVHIDRKTNESREIEKHKSAQSFIDDIKNILKD